MPAHPDHSETPATEPGKTLDLPPYGPRNPDPLTAAPGSHPIETGIGAVLGGVGSGLAVGTLTGGPIGAVIGAIVGGAAAGGLAGKGVGELIDPTTEDNWIRGYLHGEKPAPTEAQLAAQRRAFRFGLAAQARHSGKMFREVEADLRRGWEESGETLPWGEVYDSVRVAFDRTINFPSDSREAGTIHG